MHFDLGVDLSSAHVLKVACGLTCSIFHSHHKIHFDVGLEYCSLSCLVGILSMHIPC